MPQRRKQQKGAGLFDMLSSDPAKKIEANNKRIGELEKESEQKCADIKKTNDLKIGELKKKNEVLQKAADMKKAADAEQASSGSIFDGVKNFFGSKPDEAKPDEAMVKSGPMVKPVPDANVIKNPMLDNAEPKANVEQKVNDEPKANVGAQDGAKDLPKLVQEDKFNRMFGGKKSKRRRGSKARKSAKK